MQFEDYVAVRGAALLRFGYLLSRDADMAQDLVQSALVDAYRHWRRVERAEHTDAYVRRIILIRYLGWRQSLWSRELPTAAPPDARSSPDPADAVTATDTMHRLLDGLPPRSRALLVLRYYEDLDDHAIAGLMGIAPSTVRATAARALASLRSSAASPAPNPAGKEQP